MPVCIRSHRPASGINAHSSNETRSPPLTLYQCERGFDRLCAKTFLKDTIKSVVLNLSDRYLNGLRRALNVRREYEIPFDETRRAFFSPCLHKCDRSTIHRAVFSRLLYLHDVAVHSREAEVLWQVPGAENGDVQCLLVRRVHDPDADLRLQIHRAVQRRGDGLQAVVDEIPDLG